MSVSAVALDLDSAEAVMNVLAGLAYDADRQAALVGVYVIAAAMRQAHPEATHVVLIDSDQGHYMDVDSWIDTNGIEYDIADEDDHDHPNETEYWSLRDTLAEASQHLLDGQTDAIPGLSDRDSESGGGKILDITEALAGYTALPVIGEVDIATDGPEESRVRVSVLGCVIPGVVVRKGE